MSEPLFGCPRQRGETKNHIHKNNKNGLSKLYIRCIQIYVYVCNKYNQRERGYQLEKGKMGKVQVRMTWTSWREEDWGNAIIPVQLQALEILAFHTEF